MVLCLLEWVVKEGKLLSSLTIEEVVGLVSKFIRYEQFML